MSRVAVQPGDRVAVRDALGEWHPAIAESGVVRRGVRFPLVYCSLLLRGSRAVPFPAEDVLVLEAVGRRTLRDAVDDPPQPGSLIRCPFVAERAGDRVLVTAVLERTAVYEDAAPERHLARLEAFVLLGELDWVPPDPMAARERAKRGRLAAQRRKQARSGGKFAEAGEGS